LSARVEGKAGAWRLVVLIPREDDDVLGGVALLLFVVLDRLEGVRLCGSVEREGVRARPPFATPAMATTTTTPSRERRAPASLAPFLKAVGRCSSLLHQNA
jgi:hypothetical protein